MALIAKWADEMAQNSEPEPVAVFSLTRDRSNKPPPAVGGRRTVSEPSAASISYHALPRLLDLPRELLGDILLLAQQVDYRIALTFSHDSTSFREFAIRTPLIWTIISIPNYSTKRIKLHLSRSAHAPLTVQWAPYLYPRELPTLGDREDHIDEVMVLLSPHCQRIRCLRLAVWEAYWEDGVACRFLFDNNFANLEVLHIAPALIGRIYDPDELPDRYAQKGWPVRDLRLRGVVLTPSSGFWTTTLTRMSLGGNSGISLHELIEIFLKVPFLRQLTFEDLVPAGLTNPCTDIAPLYHLIHLTFSNVTQSSMSYILAHINTANLECLTFTHHQQLADDPPLPSIHPLITAALSNSQLRKLDLTQCELNPEEWQRLLSHLPDLADLRTASCMLEESHLAPLRDDPSSFCPKLQDIVLDNELYLTTSLLQALVEARQDGQSPVRTLVLRGWDSSNVDVDDVSALRGAVPCLVVDMFAPEIDQKEEERGSSEGSDWSGEDEFTDTASESD